MSRRLLAVCGVGLLALAGCGGASEPAARTVTVVDPAQSAAQDAAFATALFDHRHASLQLVGLVAQHGERPEVLRLARDLLTVHDEQMRGLGELLEAWDRPVPHVEGHTDLGDEIPGLLGPDELAQLRAAAPAAFEAQFLAVLEGHLKAAEPLAREELRLGSDPRAKAFAQAVLDELPSRLAEVAELRKG